MRKNVTLSLDMGIYKPFRKICMEKRILVSGKVEQLMSQIIEKENTVKLRKEPVKHPKKAKRGRK